LQEQVTLERGQLHRLFCIHRPLLEKCAVSPPNDIELSALAAMLHSFYNGKEYMEFRHVFRHAYTFDLRWDRMKTLVLGCEETLHLVEGKLDRFFEGGTGGDP